MVKQLIILCGGMGTRLGSLTTSKPKPMLDVDGIPFIEHLLFEASSYPFEEIVLLAGYAGTEIYNRFHGRYINLSKVIVNLDSGQFGTAGTLKRNIDLLNTDFVLMNGDSLCEINMHAFIEEYENRPKQNCNCLLSVKYMKNISRYGEVYFNKSMKIEDFVEKKSIAGAGYINLGVSILNRQTLADLDPTIPMSLEKDVYPKLVENSQIFAYPVSEDAFFIDIGIPEDLSTAQSVIPEFRRKPALFIDRDNTLTVDKGYTYEVSDLEWKPGAIELIQEAKRHNFYVFVVTNQGGLAKEKFCFDDIYVFHRAMQEHLMKRSTYIDYYAFCPHHPEGTREGYAIDCRCRKPDVGMFEFLAQKFPLDHSKSMMVGDSPIDFEAANRFGISFYNDQEFSLIGDLIRNADL